ncbi:GNAT family N-acetyltransferase [Streptomyces sp. TS71-3]|uniref:GNAT family N-acetyltransferase n=1 Tax=Streptomyces sp. TS71-3 TaxID=2733862 RepID=UPI001B090DD1|nr:GNAT family N-acetyltransferase [Streptomyces sp. TS71-3]GHJ41501.1 N-acetyltransferase [Streptomyces sp. TS71-3]
MNGIFALSEASPGDGDVVGEIHAESWKAAYAGFFPRAFFDGAVAQRRGKWREVLTGGSGTALLASLDGRPLAFCYFGPSAARRASAEIFGFYGHPDGWGSGIAPALMTASLDRIRESGFEQVHLWTLRDTPQSRRFYEKCGFTESGVVREHDYGDGNPLAQVEYERTLG